MLSRAVTFQFALDPNLEQSIFLAKCAGARRYTVNHHLARVKANLDTRSTEREAHSESGDAPEPSTPSLSWTSFSFINEFNAWKNGELEDSLVNDDGTRGLAWRHELPNDVFECASVDAARALENFTASRRGERSGRPVGFPRFQAKGKVTPRFRLRNRATPGRVPSSQPIRFTDPAHPRLPKIGSVKLFGPTRKVRRMIKRRSFPRLLGHPHRARRSLDYLPDRRGCAVPPGRAQPHLSVTPSPSASTEGSSPSASPPTPTVFPSIDSRG